MFFFFFKLSPEDVFVGFSETRRERERKREKHRSDAPNPDRRSNPQPPSGYGTELQPPEPQQPGQGFNLGSILQPRTHFLLLSVPLQRPNFF